MKPLLHSSLHRFMNKASSKVSFTCRQCHQQSQHEVATFILTSSLFELAQSHDYFETAFPWTEDLLNVTEGTSQAACQNCARDYDWNLLTVASCRLVWLQIVRAQQPLASHKSISTLSWQRSLSIQLSFHTQLYNPSARRKTSEISIYKISWLGWSCAVFVLVLWFGDVWCLVWLFCWLLWFCLTAGNR